MLSIVIAISLLSWTPPPPKFAGVSDADLVHRLASEDPQQNEVIAALRDRILNYPASQRSSLVALLIQTVERGTDHRLREGSGAAIYLAILSVTRGFYAPLSIADKDTIVAHMHRVILSSEKAMVPTIREYVKALPLLDTSDESFRVIVAILGPGPSSTDDPETGSVAVLGMSHFGDRGVRYLIDGISRGPFETAIGIGDSGTARAYKFLRRQARDEEGKYRTSCTEGLGSWALTKPADSRERAKAVHLLQVLACDHNADVKRVALETLNRIKVTPLASCPRDESERDDDESESEPAHPSGHDEHNERGSEHGERHN